MKPEKSFSRYILIIVIMALLIIVINSLSLFLNHLWHSSAPISFTVVATAIISFFGFLLLSQSPDQKWKLRDSHFRLIITATVIITYLDLVGLVAFKGGADVLPALTEDMISSFTTIVWVIIGFYFGSSALVSILSLKYGKKEEEKEEEKKVKKSD